MKPVAIFRHAETEGPGYFALFLNQHAIPWQMIHIDQGDDVTTDASQFSGLVFMGGPMSVNDDLPWIPQALSLIRAAYAQDIPLLGHCLGGQLISKALGGVVRQNPVKEIGWGLVNVADNETATQWFQDIKQFEAFHWHGETFSLPPDAINILSSAHCVNQGYALAKHLALQCHVEMEAPMIGEWCRVGADEIATAQSSPAVQTAQVMQQQMHEQLPLLHQVAERLYLHWIGGLAR